ncbi:MAG: hypothetical protein PHX87_03900 [Candidatus Peribacteraceae bacterium]|nr:hypothetical protein [Candidatus Peribacteraceae bacterium]MDD5742547.1 hypothetical protein [Candidatus Peribacteraceae bacterium]
MATLDTQQRQHAAEIQQQLQREPGLEHVQVDQNVDGEWLMSGTVATQELRRKAWAILHAEAEHRRIAHTARNWDTMRVKPEPCRSTPWG